MSGIKLSSKELAEEIALRKSDNEPHYHVYSRVGLIELIHERDKTIQRLNKTILEMRKKVKKLKIYENSTSTNTR